jgi:uncharacterized protein YdgA (DUF945 family)
MKKLGIAAIVIVILVLALPFVSGAMTESAVNNRIESMNSGQFLSAELKSYERGWLSSHALIDIGLSEQYVNQLTAMSGVAGLPTVPRLGIVVDFAHGPLAMLDGVYFGWSKMVARPDPAMPGLADLQQQLGMPYLFEFRGRHSFFGTTAFDADIPAIDLPSDDGGVKFSGATLDGTVDGARVTSNARVDSLEVNSPFFGFVMSNLRGQTDNEFLSDYVAPGTGTFSVEHLSVTSPFVGEGPVFDANNLRVGSNVTLNSAETAVDMQVTYDIESMVVSEYRVGGASLGVTLRNIDRQFLESYVELAQNAAATGNPEALMADLLPALERGLAAGPSFALDPVRFRLDDEPFDARLEVTTDPAKLPPAGSLDLQDPSTLIGIVSSHAEVTVSKALATRIAGLIMQQQIAADPNVPPDQAAAMAEAQAGLMLVTLVGQGIMTESGNTYRTELRLADGAFLLNGNPMPFGLP